MSGNTSNISTIDGQ
jgi:hypothetical protein